jgi:hypothetical protein
MPQVSVVSQLLVEGSIFCASDAESIDIRFPATPLAAEPASALVFCVGFPSELVARAARGVASALMPSRYAVHLEAANLELLRANERLAAEAQVTLEPGVSAQRSVLGPATIGRPVQAAGLEVHEIASGLIVHRGGEDELHYLNNTAAVVFQLCDGTQTVPEITAQVALAFGMAEAPGELVEACVEDLRAKRVVS